MTFMQLDVPFVATSLRKVTFTAPPQLSEAITDPMFGDGTCEKHWKACASGHVSDGTVVSFTVMACAHVLWLPHASVAR